jgi:hypothetical protein
MTRTQQLTEGADAVPGHIHIRRHGTMWAVHCDHGCNLGASHLQATFTGALRRAELHALATCRSEVTS